MGIGNNSSREERDASARRGVRSCASLAIGESSAAGSNPDDIPDAQIGDPDWRKNFCPGCALRSIHVGVWQSSFGPPRLDSAI